MFSRPNAPREFTGKHMIAVMALFFGTIISVNLTLAWFANSTWTGLVVKNSYVASQEFDAKTRELERQIAKGWQASISYNHGIVSVNLQDADGNPLSVDNLTARIGHPVTEVDDRDVELEATAAGNYSAKTELGNGLWEIILRAESQRHGAWTSRYRFTVKG